MEQRSYFTAIFALSLLSCAFSAPIPDRRLKRATDDLDNSITIEDSPSSSSSTTTRDPFDDDDDDDDFGPSPTSSSNGGGSNIFSLLRIVTALFPGSGSANHGGNLLSKFRLRKQSLPTHRQLLNVNDIEIGYDALKPSFERQEINENDSENDTQEGKEDSSEDSAENNNDDIQNGSKENSDSNIDSGGDEDDNDSDYDFDEPPGGDGGGGGLLGLLAGLSGGEDGQSDLGSLLATVSGIIANLSGDGIDLNSLIASGIGLFMGLLSEGEENPGSVIASYLLTSLDTLTGGGAKNNGEFFGSFLSKLIKGTSAAGDPDASSEEQGNTNPMADSGGFVASFIISLLGDMSKSSSGGSSHPWIFLYIFIQSSLSSHDETASPFWTLKLDIIRALFQFTTTMLGLASSSSISSSAG